MSNIVPAKPPENAAALIERVVLHGDLAKLSSEERLAYYRQVCDSVGLNPLTQPFQYITLNGKLTLYARKDATDQLRRLHEVSITIVARERSDDVYAVTARATLPSGRTDESIGAVALANVKGDALANALMKAETKAKRRVTLSICGLGILDETELETIAPAEAPRLAEKPEVSGTINQGQVNALKSMMEAKSIRWERICMAEGLPSSWTPEKLTVEQWTHITHKLAEHPDKPARQTA